jgi:hypothetical protein
MNNRPGRVDVVTEVGYCNFCGRTRNLRREEHRLGSLVRTILTCEACHRTLTTSMGVAPAEPSAEAAAVEPQVEAAPEHQAPARKLAEPAPKARPRATPKKPAAAARAATAKAKAKPAPRKSAKSTPKPRSEPKPKPRPAARRRSAG